MGSGRLAEQAPGADVVIDAVDGVVDATLLRLFEMGLVPGTPVTVTRRAPLGGPLEVTVRGTRLVLRQADARAFVVRTDGRAATMTTTTVGTGPDAGSGAGSVGRGRR